MILERGKGLVIKKYCAMQIIEANLQLLIQMLIRVRVYEMLEIDTRTSKFNRGSKK